MYFISDFYVCTEGIVMNPSVRQVEVIVNEIRSTVRQVEVIVNEIRSKRANNLL